MRLPELTAHSGLRSNLASIPPCLGDRVPACGKRLHKMSDDAVDDVVQGGEISSPPREIVVTDVPRSRTSRFLAHAFFWLLAGSYAVHYAAVALMIHYDKIEKAKPLMELFSGWLPVIAGFVGAAAAYYLTRER